MKVVSTFGITGFGIIFEQGDIVLVPVPFSDFKHQRQRPVLVISEYKRNICYTKFSVI